jgi:hypothetical protein
MALPICNHPDVLQVWSVGDNSSLHRRKFSLSSNCLQPSSCKKCWKWMVLQFKMMHNNWILPETLWWCNFHHSGDLNGMLSLSVQSSSHSHSLSGSYYPHFVPSTSMLLHKRQQNTSLSSKSFAKATKMTKEPDHLSHTSLWCRWLLR